MNDESDPLANAERLRAISKLNPASRISIDKKWALKIADQLEGLEAERKKQIKQLDELGMFLSAERLKHSVSVGGFIRRCDTCGNPWSAKNGGKTCPDCMRVIVTNLIPEEEHGP